MHNTQEHCAGQVIFALGGPLDQEIPYGPMGEAVRSILEMRRFREPISTPIPYSVDQATPPRVADLLEAINECLSTGLKSARKTRAQLAFQKLQQLMRDHRDVFGEGIDPGFGVDPTDSAELLRLRVAIDDYLGWRTDAEREAADYEERIKQVAAYVGATETAYRKLIGNP